MPFGFDKNNRTFGSLRYLRAQLRPLMRPTFWGSALFLSLLSLSIWEFTSNPEWLSEISGQLESAPVDSTDPDSVVNNTEVPAEEISPTGEDTAAENQGQVLPLLAGDTDIDIFQAAIGQEEGTEEGDETDEKGNKDSGKEKKKSNPFLTFIPDFSNLESAGDLLPKVNPQPTELPSSSVGKTRSLFSSPKTNLGENTNQESQENQGNVLERAISNLNFNSARTNNNSQEVGQDNRTLQRNEFPYYTERLENNRNSIQRQNFDNLNNSFEAPSTGNNYNTNQPQPNSFTYLTQPQVNNVAPGSNNFTPVVPNNYNNYNNYGSYNNYRQVPQQNYNQVPTNFNNNSSNNQLNSGFNQNRSNSANSSSNYYIPGRYVGGGRINTFGNPMYRRVGE